MAALNPSGKSVQASKEISLWTLAARMLFSTPAGAIFRLLVVALSREVAGVRTTFIQERLMCKSFNLSF